MTKMNIETAAMVEERLAGGESLRAIARDLGVTYQGLQYHRRRAGKPLLRKAHTRGVDHASWRGGFFVDRWGYKMVRSPESGRANPYVAEHVLVAERTAGRRVGPKEVVHHIDCDKSNNNPENLVICTRSKHKQFHGQLERVAAKLLRAGLVRWTGDGYEVS